MENIIEIVLDISELEAPYPLINSIKKLQELKNGEYLKVIHRQSPCKLFDYINQNHFTYKMIEKDKRVILYICHSDDFSTKRHIDFLAEDENV